MATDQTGKPVPGIPLAALDAITDANVRDVLRALVATHNVRNNLAGTGNDAFITTRQVLQATRTTATSTDQTAPRLLARYASGSGGVYSPGTLSGPLTTIPLSLDRAVNFHARLNWVAAGFTNADTRVEIHDGPGVVLFSHSDSVFGGYANSHATGAVFRLEAGDHAITLHAGNNGVGTYTLSRWGLLLVPVAA